MWCPAVAGAETGRVAVSAVRDQKSNAEIVVVFVQHFGDENSLAELAARIRSEAGQQAGVEISVVVPVDEIPRTTSGKIRRYALRQAFERGDFDARLNALVNQTPDSDGNDTDLSEMEETLLEICTEALGDIRLHRQDNFFELGLSSLKAIEIHELIDQRFPGKLDVSDIFEHPTLADLAGYLNSKI